MNLFGNKPEERALASLIHDTNAATFEIDQRYKAIHEKLKPLTQLCKEKGIDIPSAIYIHLEYIKSNSKNIKDAVDSYYIKAKNDFNSDASVSQSQS